MKQCQILTIKAQINGGQIVTVRRDAWALLELQAANDNGCTPIDHPGPRWSGYVHKLRNLGIVIETIVGRGTVVHSLASTLGMSCGV